MVPPPMPEDPRDTDQLRLLVVFHYIYVGLQAAGLAFLLLHYFIMQSIFGLIEESSKRDSPVLEKPEVETPPDGETIMPDPEVLPAGKVESTPVNTEEFFSDFRGLFIVFYVVGAVFLVGYIVLNFLSTRSISQRKNRVFSMVVAGINCISLPFGTALGIFTILLLGRQTVINSYEREANQSR